VLIRAGTYAERPIVDHAVVLHGISVGQRPRLSGLDILNSNFWAIPPLLSVSWIDFSDRVDYTTVGVHPRNLLLDFTGCSLNAGIELLIQDVEDVGLLAIRDSHLGGQSTGAPSSIVMEADTIDGGVSWRVYSGDGVSIRNCWFRGGDVAVHLFGGPRGVVSHKETEGYDSDLELAEVGELTA